MLLNDPSLRDVLVLDGKQVLSTLPSSQRTFMEFATSNPDISRRKQVYALVCTDTVEQLYSTRYCIVLVTDFVEDGAKHFTTQITHPSTSTQSATIALLYNLYTLEKLFAL